MNDQEESELRDKTLMTPVMVQSTQQMLSSIADIVQDLKATAVNSTYIESNVISNICRLSAAYSIILATFNGDTIPDGIAALAHESVGEDE
jgi:hypothetical protein